LLQQLYITANTLLKVFMDGLATSSRCPYLP